MGHEAGRPSRERRVLRTRAPRLVKQMASGGEPTARGPLPGTALPGNARVPPAQASSPTFVIPAQAGIYPSRGGVSREETSFPPARGTKLGRGANFRCLMSDTPIADDYINAEGKTGRMGARLMAIVAEGERGRVYLAPPSEHEERAREAQPEWRPDGDVPARLTGSTCVPYGLTTWGDLFTPTGARPSE